MQARAKANERSRQGVPATVAGPTAKRDYLYRGLLRWGICGLRMWGNHRRNTTYYSCQPSHQRSKDIPVGHPSHVYLNEQRLNDALLPFLATALFGPERTDYWRHALDAATEPERMAPARERSGEIETEIADLERRLGRRRPVARPLADPRRHARRGAPGRAASAVRLATARRRLPAGRQRPRCRSHPLRSRQRDSPARRTRKCGGPVGAPGRNRTCNLRIRSPLLYPVELRGQDALPSWRLQLRQWRDRGAGGGRPGGRKPTLAGARGYRPWPDRRSAGKSRQWTFAALAPCAMLASPGDRSSVG